MPNQQRMDERKEDGHEVMLTNSPDMPPTPRVYEFAGMPRTGKTSTVTTIVDGLRALGARVTCIEEGIRGMPGYEQASLVALNFGAWYRKLAALHQIRCSSRNEIVIVDRAAFDAFALSYFFQARGDFSPHRAGALRALLLEEMDMVDRVFLFLAQHEVCLRRDGRPDSGRTFMNKEALICLETSYHHAMDELLLLHPSLARRVVVLDTSTLTLTETAELVHGRMSTTSIPARAPASAA